MFGKVLFYELLYAHAQHDADAECVSSLTPRVRLSAKTTQVNPVASPHHLLIPDGESLEGAAESLQVVLPGVEEVAHAQGGKVGLAYVSVPLGATQLHLQLGLQGQQPLAAAHQVGHVRGTPTVLLLQAPAPKKEQPRPNLIFVFRWCKFGLPLQCGNTGLRRR